MYEVESAPCPFWGEDRNTKGGRDPLAIQNSSVMIYSDMVSGITNLTSRIRYNAFYCWLLTLIAEHIEIENIDSHKHQFRYLRRGELLFAYIMHFRYPDVTGSAGSTYAYNHDKGQILDLALGADIENKNTETGVYWKNPLGVFGQYYMGAMMQLRLVCPPDYSHSTYRPTPEGKKLQEIYSRAIDEHCEQLFWDAIYSGQIDVALLPQLESMALNNIKSEEELSEYRRILSSPDNLGGKEIYNRFNTIKLLLKYIDEYEVSTRDFVLSFLRVNLLDTLDAECKVPGENISWMLYEMNELAHSAYESYHFSILYSLNGDKPLPLDYLFKQLEDDYDSYSSYYQSNGVGDIELYDLYDRQKQHYKSRNYGALLYESLALLIKLKSHCDRYYDKLVEIAQKGDYQTHPGFVMNLLNRLLGNGPYENDWDTVKRILYMAINDHLSSSYAKSDVGQGLVHNYMLDEGVIWQLRDPDPVRTSPRLQNVIQYLEDVGLVKKEKETYLVTESGYNFMAL